MMDKEKENIKIIVIGSNHHNTFSMVKSFGYVGYFVNVILFGCDSSYIAKSKYVKGVQYLKSPNDLIACLNNKENDQNPILISCSDIVSQILDEHYDELIQQYHFFNCGEQGRLTPYLDKLLQTQLASQVGMDVPLSIIYEPGLQVNSFPCLLKPLESINGGKHIEICTSQEELEKKVKNFSSESSILLQSFIERESEIVIVGLSIGKDVLIPGYIHKIREATGGTTYSKVLGLETLDKTLVDHCKELVSSMNYIGLFGIEFIKDNNGKYYFIEINLRNDATTYSFVKAGVNLPVMFADFCMGKEVSLSAVKELYSVVDFRDLENAIHQHVSFRQWLREYNAAQCKYYKDKDDPEPYLTCLKTFLKSHLLHKLGLK